jgi:pSer/pThr/pTyr-binding forkhead associated (FHA) protein
MDLDNLSRMARELSSRAFSDQFRHPLLLVSKTQQPEEFAFRTHSNVAGDTKDSALLCEIGEVLEVAKSERNPFTSRVIVGRVRNCDIVLCHASVSKMHAQFRHDPAGPLTLVDLGSRNRTRVNGRELEPNAPAAVEPGSVIQFGDVVTQFVDPRDLRDLLMCMAPAPNRTD